MLIYAIFLLGAKCLDEENLIEIGLVTHYFSKISVAIVELKGPLKVGDTIIINGPTTEAEQVVESMQIEHENIQQAESGQNIGLKVNQRVRETDKVYKRI
jgi:putative protease